MTSYIHEPVKHLRKVRDLTLMAINDRQYLVIACDSDGGIGNKPKDTVKVTEAVIANFATRVPLFEIIACGATPFMVIDCLSVEMEPSGKKIIAEIKRYVREAGIIKDIQFTGSTEDNVPTVQTGIGVTVLGLVDQQHFTVGSSRPGDKVICVGKPKSGPKYEIHPDDPDILSLGDLNKLRQCSFVRDILPVGSKGVLYEAGQLAHSANLRFQQDRAVTVDMKQSAGPSTCVLLSLREDYIEQIAALVHAPVYPLGTLLKE